MSNRYLKNIKRKSKKSIAFLVSFLLILGVSCGVTFAYLHTQTDKIDNTFQPSHVTTKVLETFKNGEKTNVTVQNTGDTEAYIRAAVVITWQNAAGEIYGQMPVEGRDYTISYSLENGWLKASDGFYYWTKPVVPNDETGVLISTCKPLKKAPEEGYYLNVEILGSGIQSKPTLVVTSNWSSGVSGVGSDGTTLQIKVGN